MQEVLDYLNAAKRCCSIRSSQTELWIDKAIVALCAMPSSPPVILESGAGSGNLAGGGGSAGGAETYSSYGGVG